MFILFSFKSHLLKPGIVAACVKLIPQVKIVPLLLLIISHGYKKQYTRNNRQHTTYQVE